MTDAKHLQIIVLLLLLAGVVSGQAKMLELDGVQFQVYHNDLSGRKPGQPALVFENGWGADMGNWEPILEELERTQIVFTYDRTGVGESEYNEKVPSLENTAATLRSLLQKAGIPPPYILIGHSLGGVYVRGYAGLYPEEVAGVVCVDPADFTESKEDWKMPFRRIGVPEKKLDEMLYERLYTDQIDPDMPVALRQEREVLKGWRKVDFAGLRDIPLPKIPVVFFIGGRFDVPPQYRSKDLDQEALFEARKQQWMHHWSKLIDETGGGGGLIYVPGAGHFVHRDVPGIVIDNILSLVR
ncbi:alpha/beta fold hydrolase [Flavilitoribacter nigricans]|uniref:AB hydrolase-1 domain-containing protein n=1 Tax=Flavilitoribacter nigricans (strain ATCC 23147 / DSM 23189 / NBRC 102662 / NCIMB 1420 / SS-2) TaxID=1122177 RepID=A0A2D0NFR1_FLAN2|nr:alpha/beta hydrolase [Flavilitoribacter nigricans]PHN07331.1 hypothetical protein CRP01_06790 [Flavilitoribacter nigricans DSM 23189 = NBRC 102662]